MSLPKKVSKVELPRSPGMPPAPLADDLSVERGVELHHPRHEAGLQLGVEAAADHQVVGTAQPGHVHLQVATQWTEFL